VSAKSTELAREGAAWPFEFLALLGLGPPLATIAHRFAVIRTWRLIYCAVKCPGHTTGSIAMSNFKKSRPLLRTWTASAAIAGLCVLLIAGIACRAAFAAVDSEAQSGTLYLKAAPDAEPVEALRVSTDIRAQVTGNVARVHVTQQFTNPSNDWVAGLYVFPLSADSAVDELAMRLGDRTVRGEIHERGHAHALFDAASSAGKRASIVDQERPNLFSTSVANIAPHSSITVEIAYLETIPYHDAKYTLRLPLAITPRYTPGASLDPSAPLAAVAARIANAERGTTATPERVTGESQSTNIEVDLRPGFSIGSLRSLHHPVNLRDDASGRHIQLTGAQVPADRDFELVWTPAAVADVQTAAFSEQLGAETYALLLLTPPATATEHPQRREVTFIIDTSGSMSGPSIEQARAALQMGVDRLNDGDRFNIIRFSNDANSLFEAPRSATAAARTLASRFMASLYANGGTEMKPALELAFATPATEELLKQIVFITDGSVGNESELIALITARIGAARLFTVGIGAAPNAYFLQEAAKAGRGSYTFIEQREQVAERMQDLFRKLEQPALTDLQLTWPGESPADLASAVPADVYAGDPLVILARLSEAPKGILTLAGRTAGNAWTHQIPITEVGERAGIAKLWARERIVNLSQQRRLGGDAGDAKRLITDLAERHHLVSEFTSLVAVDETVVRPPGVTDRHAQAPTAAPVGSYWANASGTSTTGFAHTATPAELLLMLGLGASFMGVLLLRRLRGDPRAT
jgi:Ca-activated chloride channel homolog